MKAKERSREYYRNLPEDDKTKKKENFANNRNKRKGNLE